MRPEHGTSAGKLTLRCTLADGLTQYVRRRNRTLRGPRRRSSCLECPPPRLRSADVGPLLANVPPFSFVCLYLDQLMSARLTE